MQAALLCNGPSREGFLSSDKKYDYIMACNAPWYNGANATVVIDDIMVRKWYENPELIECNAHFSKKAWICAGEPQWRGFFEKRMISIIDVSPDFDSSGHVACRILLKQGYTEIDIWGCDSWFDNTIASYTHNITPNLNPDDSPKHIKGWRDHWIKIVERYPNAKINFKR